MSTDRYSVIISDRAKSMLGVQLKFIARVNKNAALKTKEDLIDAIRSLQQMPQRFPFLRLRIYHQTNTTNCSSPNGTWSFTRFETIPFM